MALVGALPTLSWVEACTTTHLTAAADRFAATADLWDRAFTQLASDLVRPGGTEWTGDGAEAAQDNVDKTAVTARGASNQLRDAAGIATLGADQLDGLHQKTVAAIGDARGDGFQVNEDLSVTDTRRHRWGSNAYVARQAEAEDHAETIHSYAGQLLALDNQYATKLDTATAGLETLTLDAPGGDTPPVNDHNGIQLVDNDTFKQSPLPEPGAPDEPVGHHAGRSAAEIRGVTGRLPEGTKPNIKLVQTEQQLRDMYKWATENGRAVPNAYGPNSGTA